MKSYSMREILKISVPLMMSALGFSIMIFCDRLILSRYNIDAMNAVASVGIMMFMLDYTISSICVTSEIYSGQYNGAKQYHLAALPAWQMLFVGIASSAIYIPISLLGKYILPQEFLEHGLDFFKYLVMFLCFAPMLNAINGFFIGIKDTTIISVNAFFGSVINIVLAYILIFGVEDIIPAMGAAGSAIASGLCLMLEFVIIFMVFRSKKYDKKYNTRKWHFDKKIMFGCLRLGAPSAISFLVEISGIFVAQLIVAKFAPEYLTIHNIAANLYIVLNFIIVGMHKGISGIAANMIGAGEERDLTKLLYNGLIIYSVCALMILFIAIALPEQFVGIFTDDSVVIEQSYYALLCIAIHFIGDGIGWIITGVTIAGGDTRFMMYANIILTWMFRVLPMYLCFSNGYKTAWLSWFIAAVVSVMYPIVFALRFKYGNWNKLKI